MPVMAMTTVDTNATALWASTSTTMTGTIDHDTRRFLTRGEAPVEQPWDHHEGGELGEVATAEPLHERPVGEKEAERPHHLEDSVFSDNTEGLSHPVGADDHEDS